MYTGERSGVRRQTGRWWDRASHQWSELARFHGRWTIPDDRGWSAVPAFQEGRMSVTVVPAPVPDPQAQAWAVALAVQGLLVASEMAS
jgi:hypothetical protein